MSYYSSAVEVLPGLWLGDTNAVKDTSFITNKQIGMIINCSNDGQFPNNPTIKLKHSLCYLESNNYKTNYSILEECCQLIRNNINCYNILVYNQYGHHLSTLLIIFYLFVYGQMGVTQCLNCLETKRQGINDVKRYYTKFLYNLNISR